MFIEDIQCARFHAGEYDWRELSPLLQEIQDSLWTLATGSMGGLVWPKVQSQRERRALPEEIWQNGSFNNCHDAFTRSKQ